MLPEKIGRYEIYSELGRGAMGVVYRAVDPTIGRTVALKTMRMDVHGAHEEEMLKRFKREAQLAGLLSHPNIVTIYDAGEHEGHFYIAMEFVEGETLQKVLHAERTLEPERIIEFSRQICAGLDLAHSNGVIHRDVKPANVMVGANRVVKIMDFGIAKSAAVGMTSAGQVLGTPTYMSPEQVKGKTLDGRSDLFSYGVILYEMVTGEKPFTGQNVTTIIYKIINEEPIPPRELDVSIHPGLSAIITKCLAKDVTKRYQSGAELVRDLEDYKSFGGNIEETKAMTASAAGLEPTPAAVQLSDMPTVRLDASHASAPSATIPSAPATTAASTTPASATGPAKAAPTSAHSSSQATPHPVVGDSVSVSTTTAATSAAAAKPATVIPHIQSTVGVSHSTPQSAPPQKKRPNALIAIVAVVVLALGAGAYLKSHKSPATAQQAAKSAPPASALPATTAAVTQPPPVQEKRPAIVNATTGDLRVTSKPEGAAVTIGGATQKNWKTPFTATKLDPGDYDVVFSMPGFVTVTRSVTVTVGKSATISADLIQKGATVVVSSDPVGANIVVDGKPTGQTTPATLRLNAGSHNIIVRKPGFTEENTSLTLTDGQSSQYSPKLDAVITPKGQNPWSAFKKVFGSNENIPAGKGMVTIRTRPAGATVFHNGHPSPTTTPMRVPMEPGTYDVIIRLQGYRQVRREFTVEKGKLTDVSVDLVQK